MKSLLLKIIIIMLVVINLITLVVMRRKSEQNDIIINYNVEPNELYEPKLQYFLATTLAQSLYKLRPPFSFNEIKNCVVKVENSTHLYNQIKLISYDTNSYKILISTNTSNDNKEELYLLTQESLYFLMPKPIYFQFGTNDQLSFRDYIDSSNIVRR